MENFNTTIFSYFEYKSDCGGAPLRVPMEPLVGLMRHPHVVGSCADRDGQPPMIDTRHDTVGVLQCRLYSEITPSVAAFHGSGNLVLIGMSFIEGQIPPQIVSVSRAGT